MNTTDTINWLSRASSVFVGVVGALALLAVPTYIWLTRELDRVHTDIADNSAALARIEAGIDKVVQTVQHSVDRSNDAFDRSKFTQEMLAYIASHSEGSSKIVSEWLFASLPNEKFLELEKSGALQEIRGVRLNDREIIFIDKASLNRFTLEQRDMLADVEKVGGPKLIIWDTFEFPGYKLEN